MGTDRAGVSFAPLGLRSFSFLGVLAVIAAALVIHLFGPALQVSTAAESPEHAHSNLELGPAHPSDAAVGSVVKAHAEETCHAVLGVSPATTALPVVTCVVRTWRQDAQAASDRTGLRPAWIGGDGGNTSLDPRRSPGVQRT